MLLASLLCRNMSAVCVFSAGAIRQVFETSSFKGNTAEIPVPRPGSVSITYKTLLLNNH